MTTETIDVQIGTPDAEAPSTDAGQQVEQNPKPTESVEGSEAQAADEAAKAVEKAKEKKSNPPWVQKRIDQYAARAKAAEAELQVLRARSEPVERTQEQDINQRAEQIANQRIAQTRFDDACNAMYSAGVKDFEGNFDTAISTLGNVLGEDYRPFLEAVVDAGVNSPALLMHFAENPDEAAEFTDLNPRAQGLRLAKIEARLEAKKNAKPSSAPAPVSPVGASGSANQSAAGTVSEAEWYARREAELKKRK